MLTCLRTCNPLEELQVLRIPSRWLWATPPFQKKKENPRAVSDQPLGHLWLKCRNLSRLLMAAWVLNQQALLCLFWCFCLKDQKLSPHPLEWANIPDFMMLLWSYYELEGIRTPENTSSTIHQNIWLWLGCIYFSEPFLPSHKNTFSGKLTDECVCVCAFVCACYFVSTVRYNVMVISCTFPINTLTKATQTHFLSQRSSFHT